MRRKEKQIQDKAVIEQILHLCPVGSLGTMGSDGYPRIKPLNFAYRDGHIYFHTARAGEKIDDIRRDNRVCFAADIPVAYVTAKAQPCEANYLFRSIMIRGRAHLVEDEAEKLHALRVLMEKYQPGRVFSDPPKEKLAVVGVIRIDVEEMTGKENLGEGPLRETALNALAHKPLLSLVLER